MHVQFAVGEAGKGFQLDQLSGNHKGGEGASEVNNNFLRSGFAGVEQVQQLLLLVVQGTALVNTRKFGSGTFNFAQLNAVTHMFDLKIFSGSKAQLPILIIIPQISRPVHRLQISVIQWILYDLLKPLNKKQ